VIPTGYGRVGDKLYIQPHAASAEGRHRGLCDGDSR
jgi:hypothetical protein